MRAKHFFRIFIFAATLRTGTTIPKCAIPLAKIDTISTVLESSNNLLFWDKINNPAGFPANIQYPVMLYSSKDR